MNPNPNLSADPARTASPPSPALQRGKACLSCRRRKMRCDGARPICTPCLRGERAEDCEYTDGQRRPRTLELEEDVARLRARVQELENPAESTPSVELHAPYAIAGPSTARSAFVGNIQASSSSADPLRIESEANALSVIGPYATELGFFLNIDRLRVQGTRVPALRSALTLWSILITSASEPGHAQAHERTRTFTSDLLSQAQTQLAVALSTVDAEPDSAVFLHLIQTGVLLAYYMQRVGLIVGARYYASGTWTLAMMLKLYQSPYLSGRTDEGESQSLRGGDRQTRGTMNVCTLAFAQYARLTRPLDGIEAEERVRAFWEVYGLDRWFSSVGQWPTQSLVMDGGAITVPWPDVGPVNEARNVIQHLLNDPRHDFMRDGPSAMHAKASVLLGEAAAVVASYVADNAISQSAAFRARFAALDASLQRCFNAAMTLATGRQTQAQEQAQALVTAHLTAFALVTLHRPLILTPSGPPQRRCVEVAFDVIQVLDRTGATEIGVGSISAIYVTVWTGLCLALYDEVLRLRARSDAGSSRRREEAEMAGGIRTLAGMMSALSQRNPCRFFAVKIETVLRILESIAV